MENLPLYSRYGGVCYAGLFFAAGGGFGHIVAADAAGGYVGELGFIHEAARRRHAVHVDYAFEVVALMLHYAGQEAGDFLGMFLEILVEPC